MAKLLKESGDELDAHVKSVANTFCAGDNGPLAVAGKIQLATSVLSSFTPALLFERCIGEFCPIANADDLHAPDLRKPLHMGRLANIDEVYATFSEFGLVQDNNSCKQGSSSNLAAVNNHAGTFNRFLQFGECARATKTAGSYGGGHVDPVSFGMGGNMHPGVGVPMERGEIGNHTGCTKERFLMFAAPRVQPHEDLPENYVMPDDVEKHLWVELDEELADMSGLGDAFADPEMYAARMKDQRADAPRQDVDHVPDQSYLPDEDGYVFLLPDGVESRLRWRTSGGAPVAEMRIANRSFAMPPNMTSHPLQNESYSPFSQ